jgi:uncharacterized protein DUF4240
MMSENQFWNLIADAKAAVGNTKEIPDWLEQKLLEFHREEITDFGAWLATFLDRSNDERLWAAGSIVAGGMSDDAFVYFQCWLIAQGKNIFEKTLANPDSLADIECSDFGLNVNLEKLLYVSTKVSRKKLIETPSNYQPPFGSSPKRTERKNIGFLSQSNSTRATVFPKLTKRFGKS